MGRFPRTGTEESGAFVNGVLDRIADDAGRKDETSAGAGHKDETSGGDAGRKDETSGGDAG